LDPTKRWLGVALAAPVTFPTARDAALIGESKPTVQPRVVVEKRMVWSKVPLLRLAATMQAGWRFRPRTEVLDLDLAGELTYGVGLHWDPVDRVRVGSEVSGAVGRGPNGRYAEWLGSVRIIPDPRKIVSVSAGAGLGIGRGVGTPEGRFFVGATIGVPLKREPKEVPPDSLGVSVSPEVEVPVQTESQPPIPGVSDDSGWGLRLVGREMSLDARMLFEFDSAKLLRTAHPVLDEVARWALAHPNSVLEVSGHTDPLGSLKYNEGLSQARADAVVRALVRAGVSKDRLRAVARGESEALPAGDGSTPAERWSSSRRVQFRLLEPIIDTDPDPLDSRQPGIGR